MTTNKTKTIIALIGLGIIAAIFLIAGIARAIDAIVLNNLETTLANNITAKKAITIACDSSYESLKSYKLESKMPLIGTDNPCDGF